MRLAKLNNNCIFYFCFLIMPLKSMWTVFTCKAWITHGRLPDVNYSGFLRTASQQMQIRSSSKDTISELKDKCANSVNTEPQTFSTRLILIINLCILQWQRLEKYYLLIWLTYPQCTISLILLEDTCILQKINVLVCSF